MGVFDASTSQQRRCAVTDSNVFQLSAIQESFTKILSTEILRNGTRALLTQAPSRWRWQASSPKHADLKTEGGLSHCRARATVIYCRA